MAEPSSAVWQQPSELPMLLLLLLLVVVCRLLWLCDGCWCLCSLALVLLLMPPSIIMCGTQVPPSVDDLKRQQLRHQHNEAQEFGKVAARRTEHPHESTHLRFGGGAAGKASTQQRAPASDCRPALVGFESGSPNRQAGESE